ncbi:hypothetical protein BDA99DRAFT_538034 [Phascolomyces articulosus]|uniref:Uncharacterized protein n=1 Tax=Phascolomyces articulosus TaxID=60185 RepID=A0AAD5JZH2_9FUNG|nr:hypothetical protein BDA99DRAFT_538034 [Phascolomyces articulosus]
MIITTILVGLIIILILWRWIQSKPPVFGKVTPESQWSTLINTMIYKLPPIVPTWCRVYAIGVVDTIATVLWRRTVKANTMGHLLKMYGKQQQEPDRLCIITGGDSGIGLEIARGLLQDGLRVVIASRTTEFMQQAKAQLGDKNVEYLIVDLTSFKSIQQFVEQVKTKIPKGGIDILINNAGIMNTPCHITEDGFEAQFQTNCISPFYLSLLLLPWLNKKQGRILFAASSTLYAASPELDVSLAKKHYGWDGLTHYAHSKLFISMLTRYLGHQLRDQVDNEIQVFCYHPGAVRTKLFSHTTVFTLPIFSYLFDFIMLTPSEGAMTPLYLCLASNLPKQGTIGNYWSSTVIQPFPQCEEEDDQNQKNVKKAWKSALDFCGLTIPQAEALIHE